MATIDGKAVNSMKVAELKEELKARGLDTKGTKAVLAKRLKASLAEENGNNGADGEFFGDLLEQCCTGKDYRTAHKDLFCICNHV